MIPSPKSKTLNLKPQTLKQRPIQITNRNRNSSILRMMMIIIIAIMAVMKINFTTLRS